MECCVTVIVLPVLAWLVWSTARSDTLPLAPGETVLEYLGHRLYESGLVFAGMFLLFLAFGAFTSVVGGMALDWLTVSTCMLSPVVPVAWLWFGRRLRRSPRGAQSPAAFPAQRYVGWIPVEVQHKRKKEKHSKEKRKRQIVFRAAGRGSAVTGNVHLSKGLHLVRYRLPLKTTAVLKLVNAYTEHTILLAEHETGTGTTSVDIENGGPFFFYIDIEGGWAHPWRIECEPL